jgi:hypothetical protein
VVLEVKGLISGLIKKDHKGIWEAGINELNEEFFRLVHSRIHSFITHEENMPSVKWVLKSNLYSHLVDKHVVECPDATRLLTELRQQEDMSTASMK